MERDIDLKKVSDGRLYDLNDMVKADCRDCTGCSTCCRGMGSSIILDPLDVHRLRVHLGMTLEEMLDRQIELNVVDGVILPDLKMSILTRGCSFLNKEGRCSIHAFRPGICRLFPLGRLYENGSFRYFIQIHECPHPARGKVKVKKWIDTPDPKRYEKFVNDWHYFVKDFQNLSRETQDVELSKTLSMYLLRAFYLKPFGDDFYGEFDERLEAGREILDRTGR